MKRFFFIFFCFSFIYTASAQNSIKPKYIFLFIGDGMGLVQSQLADAYLRATKNDSISYMYFPNNGLQTTYSLSSKITCSAASGTAIACGKKTMANFIGIGPNGKDTLESIAVKAKKIGYKVGILTSVSIDHATPAVFYAHDASRNSYHSIAMQLASSKFDFFGGGAFLEPIQGNENVYTSLSKNNYALVTSPDSLQYVSKLGKKVCVFDLKKDFAYGIDNEINKFTLPNITQTAIETLYNPQGFFIMVEGGKIDWACHSNDAGTAIFETIELHKSVKKAIEFYKNHKDETLIIVTADHETGGMAIGSALYPYYTNISLMKNQKVSYVAFEQIIKEKLNEKNSVFTFNSCMELLKTYYNVGIPNGVTFTAYDSLRIKKAYEFVMSPLQTTLDEETKLMYNSSTLATTYAPQNRSMAIVITMNTILAEKAGIGWTTFAHTGTNIPVYAIGNGSEFFNGLYDNTDISKKITLFLTK